LLAVPGTVAGGVVKGYWDTNLAERDFQSRLILRALEPDSVEQRVTSLQFLVDANLISDPAVRNGLQNILKEGTDSIPQFLPVGASTSISSLGVNNVGSARGKVIEKHPVLQGKNVALVGFRVRHGDIIDAVTPIYAEVTPKLELKGRFEGERVGGTGGGETVLFEDGYVVSGFDVQRGSYFGRSEVIHIQVYWNRLTGEGIDAADARVSKKLGGGNYVEKIQPAKTYRAAERAFISDFVATVSHHTSGETFLNDIEISETVIVQR
jgi:hypothetical protein